MSWASRRRSPLPRRSNTVPEWRDALEANTPGAPASPGSIAPILILQGTADTIITVDSSELVADRYCDLGASAELRILDGEDHISVLVDHLADIDDWISQRLAGTPSEGCPQGGRPRPFARAPICQRIYH